MAAPGAPVLLRVWEQGLDQSPTSRALQLLAAASPDASYCQLAALPLGERDAALLRLRESLFGDRIEAVAQCPACTEQLQLSFTVDELLDAAGADGSASKTPAAGSGEAAKAGRMTGPDLHLRAVTSADILAVAQLPAGERPRALAARCITPSGRGGAAPAAPSTALPAAGTVDAAFPAGFPMLPDDVLAAVEDQLAGADPLARMEMSLVCPDCGHAWLAPFNVVSFLWAELHHWALRLLRDVHALARAYGWREADILDMNPYRRRHYLELVGS